MAQNKFKKNQGKGKGSASIHNKLSEDMVAMVVMLGKLDQGCLQIL